MATPEAVDPITGEDSLRWDPFETLGQALWIGGAQWAGKSTVARILARRHGLTAYHHDYHNARAHDDRRIAALARQGAAGAAEEHDFERMWVRRTPAEMATEVLESFPRQFVWILDDLRALVSGRPLVAEGWALRPELVAPLISSPRRMLVMVPTEEFRHHQAATLDRARSLAVAVSDPERALRNRLERDRLIAADAVASARRLGIEVLEVDGSRTAEGVADLVAEHFAAYLPATSG